LRPTPARTISNSRIRRQFAVLELDAAGGGLGLAADQVEHCGFAGAVGADDHAEFVTVDVQVERSSTALKPSKDTVRLFDGQQEHLRCTCCSFIGLLSRRWLAIAGGFRLRRGRRSGAAFRLRGRPFAPVASHTPAMPLGKYTTTAMNSAAHQEEPQLGKLSEK
jgi:hypothetical protein